MNIGLEGWEPETQPLAILWTIECDKGMKFGRIFDRCCRHVRNRGGITTPPLVSVALANADGEVCGTLVMVPVFLGPPPLGRVEPGRDGHCVAICDGQ